jgi:hypothetical protein
MVNGSIVPLGLEQFELVLGWAAIFSSSIITHHHHSSVNKRNESS